MTFKLFDRRELEAFAEMLALDLGKRYPPAADGDNTRAQSKKLANALEEVFARALKYSIANKLGIYGKAKFGNAFKWKLKELGYGETFIDQITQELVARLARK